MANMQECIDTLRRRIGDTDTPATFDDDLLSGYISDAVSEVELDYPRGITTDLGLFVDDITTSDVVLFSIKAHYLLTLRSKDKAGRDNFRMVKGRLTLDNTGQAKDHETTIYILEREYIRVLNRIKTGGGSIQGVRVE